MSFLIMEYILIVPIDEDEALSFVLEGLILYVPSIAKLDKANKRWFLTD